MQSKLKEILETYINDYEKLEDEYSRIEIKCILFDGLLKLFDMDYQDYENKSFYISLQLNEIYKDSIYADEFSRLLVVNGKIKCRKSVNLNVGFPTSFLMIQLLLR